MHARDGGARSAQALEAELEPEHNQQAPHVLAFGKCSSGSPRPQFPHKADPRVPQQSTRWLIDYLRWARSVGGALRGGGLGRAAAAGTPPARSGKGSLQEHPPKCAPSVRSATADCCVSPTSACDRRHVASLGEPRKRAGPRVRDAYRHAAFGNLLCAHAGAAAAQTRLVRRHRSQAAACWRIAPVRACCAARPTLLACFAARPFCNSEAKASVGSALHRLCLTIVSMPLGAQLVALAASLALCKASDAESFRGTGTWSALAPESHHHHHNHGGDEETVCHKWDWRKKVLKLVTEMPASGPASTSSRWAHVPSITAAPGNSSTPFRRLRPHTDALATTGSTQRARHRARSLQTSRPLAHSCPHCVQASLRTCTATTSSR